VLQLAAWLIRLSLSVLLLNSGCLLWLLLWELLYQLHARRLAQRLAGGLGLWQGNRQSQH
jgi:hypothetical protein